MFNVYETCTGVQVIRRLTCGNLCNVLGFSCGLPLQESILDGVWNSDHADATGLSSISVDASFEKQIWDATASYCISVSYVLPSSSIMDSCFNVSYDTVVAHIISQPDSHMCT